MARFHNVVAQYRAATDRLARDLYINVSEYRFEPVPLPPRHVTETKVVRFKDNLIEEAPEGARRQLMPYSDAEPGARDDALVASSFDAQSNQQLFAQHQQQLLQQEDDLGVLHLSVSRQHQMGVDIHQEVDEHVILLGDLELGVDRAYTRLSRALSRLRGFRRACRENGSMVTIVVLTVILLVLLVVLN